MESLRTTIRKHPLAAAVCVAVASLGGNKLIAQLFSLIPGSILPGVLAEIFTMIFTVSLVLICGYGYTYKTRGLRKTLLAAKPHLLLYAPLLLLTILLNLFVSPDTQWLPAGEILYGLLILFGIGFNEESIFRGVIVNLLADKGLNSRREILRVVFLSSLVFGVLHMSNVLHGVTVYSALFQSLNSVAAGCLFAAYYLRGGSLWGVMFIHALQNASGLFDYLFLQGGDAAVSINHIGAQTLLITAVFFLIALVLLRKSKCEEIIARYAKESPAA